MLRSVTESAVRLEICKNRKRPERSCRVLYYYQTVGIIADSFRKTLDALIEQDRKSQEETKQLLANIDQLITDLEAIDFEE